MLFYNKTEIKSSVPNINILLSRLMGFRIEIGVQKKYAQQSRFRIVSLYRLQEHGESESL